MFSGKIKCTLKEMVPVSRFFMGFSSGLTGTQFKEVKPIVYLSLWGEDVFQIKTRLKTVPEPGRLESAGKSLLYQQVGDWRVTVIKVRSFVNILITVAARCSL